MAVSLHETCLEYYNRRISEGWKCISLKGYNAVLQSPEGLLRPIDLRNDVLTLRPDAPGDECNLDNEIGCSSCPNHYDCVDETSPDEHVTRCGTTSSSSYLRDLYNLTNHVVGVGTINSVKAFARCKDMFATTHWASLKIAIKTNGFPAESGEIQITTSWIDYSFTWNTNPITTNPFTWAEIDLLQAGFAAKTSGPSPHNTFCTQIYVEVDYTPVVAPTVTTQAVDGIGFD